MGMNVGMPMDGNNNNHHCDDYKRKNIMGSQNGPNKGEGNFCHQYNMKGH